MGGSRGDKFAGATHIRARGSGAIGDMHSGAMHFGVNGDMPSQVWGRLLGAARCHMPVGVVGDMMNQGPKMRRPHGPLAPMVTNQPVVYDIVTGEPLDPELVRQAREEELAHFREHGVYRKVPLGQCWAETNKPPIGVRWVDTNRGTGHTQSTALGWLQRS